ncbi:MAG: hypothetical protein HFACDABA_01862 [Anaerolineales bacterium]|nr:hypothetical protein [Anaerolineales bacterium]
MFVLSPLPVSRTGRGRAGGNKKATMRAHRGLREQDRDDLDSVNGRATRRDGIAIGGGNSTEELCDAHVARLLSLGFFVRARVYHGRGGGVKNFFSAYARFCVYSPHACISTGRPKINSRRNRRGDSRRADAPPAARSLFDFYHSSRRDACAGIIRASGAAQPAFSRLARGPEAGAGLAGRIQRPARIAPARPAGRIGWNRVCDRSTVHAVAQRNLRTRREGHHGRINSSRSAREGHLLYLGESVCAGEGWR